MRRRIVSRVWLPGLALVCVGQVACGQNPVSFATYGGDLRLRATFAAGEPVADLGAGERRLSRIWGQPLSDRLPWDGSRGRIALGDCLVPGQAAGRHAFDPRTDAAFRGLGNLNAQSGTFAFRVRHSEVFERGGLLFSAKSFVAGGPRGGMHWALGIGGDRASRAMPGRLFLTTSAVQCVSEQPMPEQGWVHVAAVWDADMGAKLYVDGTEVASSWRSPQPAAAEAVPKRTFYPTESFEQDVSTSWRVSSGVGQRTWHPLLEALPWNDARIAWEEEGFLRVDARRTERLQLRSPGLRGLPPGPRVVTLRFRQRYPEDLAPAARHGIGLRLTLREEQNGRPVGEPTYVSFKAAADMSEAWQEISRVFTLGSGAEGETFSGNFDLNIFGPGVLEIASVQLLEASPETVAAAGGAGLLAAHGAYWDDIIHDVVPVPVERIHLHRHENGGPVTDIHVFDVPLTAVEIVRLARAEVFEPGVRPLRTEPTHPDSEKRRRWLGWGEATDGDLIPLAPTRPLTVREQPAERAYEDLRAAGSMAVDGIHFTLSPWPYHGYAFVTPRKLHLTFAAPARANYLIARGNLSGSLCAGGSRAEPFAGEPVLELPGTPTVFRKKLDGEFQAESATVLRTDGRVSGLHFYHLDPAAPFPPPARTYHLHGAGDQSPPLGEWKRQEFVTAYGPADRRFVTGRPDAGRTVEVRPMAAFRAHHFFTPAMPEDFPLAGIGLRLNLRGLDAPTRLQVRVHDGFDSWRELGRWDFLLEAPTTRGAEGLYEVALVLRETLALKGEAVWTTVIVERDAQLVYRPGGGESLLLLYEADSAKAERNFLEWELAGWRNAFESISEPRVWSRGITDEDEDDGWWLRAASPEYEHMVRVGRELRRRYADDARVQAWFAFIHPSMPNPSRHIEPPNPGPHPRWAVLARANLHLYARFVDWWTDNRAHENGEFGNWVGDDTDLLQDWPDLAMIDDPTGRYTEVVRKLADAMIEDFETRGRTFIVNGLNSRWTDGLHAYEDGMNMMPMAFQLEYGHPVLFHRLLETASRYDGFLLSPEQDGMRRFNSEGAGTVFWNTDRPPAGSPYDRNWYLATHAGQVLMWYNGCRKVSDMFAQVATWLFRSRAEGVPVDLARGGRDLMLALWSRFVDERYLAELIDLDRARNERILSPPPDPTLVKRLPAGLFDPALSLAASRENAPERFEDIGTRSLGFGDRRYERNWFEWYLSRDKTYLEEGLIALYRRLTFSMPAVTVAEQSGDRVSIPKQLISHMYLGGVPVARNNQFYPMYAVSYEGMGRDFAALVLEDTEDLLRVLFYSFEDAPRRGLMRVWGLGPGEFEITGGPDRTGNDRLDAVEHRRKMTLVRGDGFEIEIPPRHLYVWEAVRTRAGQPLHQRPDLAISADDAHWAEDGSLTVRLHNIGAAPAQNVEVVLQKFDHQTLATRIVPRLEAPLDLQPKTAVLVFTPAEIAVAGGPGAAITVTADPQATIEEITRRNNRATLARPK